MRFRQFWLLHQFHSKHPFSAHTRIVTHTHITHFPCDDWFYCCWYFVSFLFLPILLQFYLCLLPYIFSDILFYFSTFDFNFVIGMVFESNLIKTTTPSYAPFHTLSTITLLITPPARYGGETIWLMILYVCFLYYVSYSYGKGVHIRSLSISQKDVSQQYTLVYEKLTRYCFDFIFWIRWIHFQYWILFVGFYFRYNIYF